MNEQNIQLLIREGEGLTLEMKERYTARIDEDLVAFANVKGGTLLIGVSDDGQIVGEQLTNDLKAKINSVARNCKPSITVNMAQVGKVVVIEVPEGTEKPYSCSSGYFRRLNGTTQKMNHDELRMMFAEHNTLPFEEKTTKRFTFEDISSAKVRAFTKEAEINIGRASLPDFLRSLKVADETRVKNAGILFFAKDMYEYIHQAQMTLVAFKGIEKDHIYDRVDVRDDLLTQFNVAMAFLKKHLNVRSEIRGVNRFDIYEIPLEVLREAVVNALMHRDYSITGTQIDVQVYDDRVEITNPGGLPKGLTPKKFGTISIRRNELIADLFFRMQKVERTGMGITKMKEAMVAAGLREPAFEPDEFFRAVFFRSAEWALKGSSSGAEKSSEKSSKKSNEKSSEKILRLVRENSAMTMGDMVKSLGLSQAGVGKILRKLKQEGRLRRVGPDKGGHWEVGERNQKGAKGAMSGQRK